MNQIMVGMPDDFKGQLIQIQNVIGPTVAVNIERALYVLDQLTHHKIEIGEDLNLKRLKGRAINKAMEVSKGNVSAAAKLLGIKRQTLHENSKKGVISDERLSAVDRKGRSA